MPEIRITNKEVWRALCRLDVNKVSGPDGIPAILLMTCAAELSPVLTRVYRLSFKTGMMPKSWKLANVQPVPKKGNRADPANYRPISITSILCKIMERVLNSRLLAYLEGAIDRTSERTNYLLSARQYGFRRNRSTGDLLLFVPNFKRAIEGNGKVVAVSLDISKAFDRVWHAGLISNLSAYGISPGLIGWIFRIQNPKLVEANLHSPEHRRRIASLSVFYRLHFGECALELHELIPPSPFHHRMFRRTAGIHPYVVDIPSVRSKRFASSFLIRTARDWNNLPASVFPSEFNMGVLKGRVNSLLG